jgi:cytochrome c5
VAASGPKSAEDIYKSSCASCHGTGLLNAPRFGNAEDWAPRIAKGLGVLQTHAINGFNSMPPMGACAGCTEDDIRAVVEFLVERGK